MILPESFELKVGFDRIREMIAQNCLCKLGRDYVGKIVMGCNYQHIVSELSITDDIRKIILFEEHFPQDNYIDVTPALNKIRVEGTYAEVEELTELRKSLITIRELQRFFHSSEIRNKYPVAGEVFSELHYFPVAAEKIDGVLSKEGTVRDNASPALKTIREQLKSKQVLVNRKMQTILRSARKDGITDNDAEITFRNGRPVIPVSSGNKRALNGLVHDESASGKTIYIEPGDVVTLNNEIRELEYAERREIIKILILLADSLRPFLDELIESYILLGRVDFLRAKAKIAIKLNCIKPILEETQGFSWRETVHPLLFLSHTAEGKEIIPLDISLDDRNRILIISGPNAGGKSVCLKTTGLVQYMLQCGLLVPMKENSTACLFHNIFIEIGDEQSLENDLSTYSSHLLNLKKFLRYADENTLILIDEFGSGTEPVLGGAIAEAILEELNSRQCYGVVTTHYANLKHFASDTPGIINGAMLFDTNQIMPLFRLSIGKPGSSFAIDIARKIGLPEAILAKASEKAGDQYMNYEKHLRDIIRDKKYWEDKRKRIRNVEKTLDNLYSNYSNELQSIQKERKKILNDARNEAKSILSEANRNIERTIREIRESNAQKENTLKKRKELEDYKKMMTGKEAIPDEIDDKLQEIELAGKRIRGRSENQSGEKNKEEKPERDFMVKDLVRLPDIDTIGEVLEVYDKTCLVAFGNMITTVEKSKLLHTDENTVKKKKGFTFISDEIKQKKLEFKSVIDVRGMRGDEALSVVRDFIDYASVAGVNDLKIIHGKGNGILRQLIREYLKSMNFIRSVRDEHADRGGTGTTLVELDL